MFILLLSSIKTVGNNKNLTVSVIIPAYNEEKTVGNVVRVVKSLNYINEVIVVDDGSTDQDCTTGFGSWCNCHKPYKK